MDTRCVSGNTSAQFLDKTSDKNFKILPYKLFHLELYILLTKPGTSCAILNCSNSRGKHKAAIFRVPAKDDE